MKISGRRCLVVALLLMGWLLGCTAAPGDATPPLTAQAARQTLDGWNPNHCKVTELYGFHKPTDAATTQVAYVLVANPGDRAQKPLVYAARFQLLTLADGQQKWFLTSLVSHSSGLTRRQGWDNLLIPVKEASGAAVR